MSDAYSINAKIDGDSSGFTSAIEQAEKALDGLTDSVEGTEKTTGKSTSNIKDGLKSWGVNLDKLYDTGSGMFKKFGIDIEAFASKLGTNGKIVAAVVAIGAALIKVGKEINKYVEIFGDYEEGLREVFTLLPEMSNKSIKEMSDDVDSLSIKLGLLPEELIPSLYQSISAGVPPDSVFEFMQTAGEAAKGGVASLTESVDVLSSIINAYGDDISTAEDKSDALFTAVKLGKTTFGELSSSLYNVIPTAASLGISFDEVAAGLAAITIQGVPTSVATTQMRQLFVELSKSSFKVAQDFERLTGTSFREFIAQGGTVSDALAVLTDYAEDSNVGVNELFSSVEAGNAALQLTGTGGERFAKALEEMANKSGATKSAFDIMTSTVNQSKKVFEATLVVLQKDIGEMFAPLAVGITEASTRVLEILIGLVDTLQPILSPILDIIGTILSELFGVFGSVFASINRVVQEFGGVWGVVGGEVSTVSNMIIKIFTTLGTAIGAVVDIIASILVGDWGRAWTQMQLIALTAVDLVLTAASTLVNALLVLVNGLITQVNGVVAGVMTAVSKVAGLFGKEVDATVYQIKNIGQVSFSEATGITKKIDDLNEKLAEDTKARTEKTTLEVKKAATEKTAAVIESAASQLQASSDLYEQSIKRIENEKKAAIDSAKEKKVTEKELTDSILSFDAEILSNFRLNAESQKSIAIEKAKKNNATEKEISDITKLYDNQVTDYKRQQEIERDKVASDYRKTLVAEEKKVIAEQEKNAAETLKLKNKADIDVLKSATDRIKSEKESEIKLAQDKKLTTEDVVAILDSYHQKELDSYTAMVNAERDIALKEANEKKSDAETILNINKDAENKITVYQNEQTKERKDIADKYTESLKKSTKSIWESFSDDINKNAADWSDVFNSVQGAVTNIATDGLKLIGESLVTGEMDWASWGDMAMNAFAGILQALGAQLAAMAAAKLLMGDFAGAALAAAGSAAAYVASGVVGALQETGDAAADAVTSVDDLAASLGSIEGVSEAASTIFSGENAADIKSATEKYTSAINAYNDAARAYNKTLWGTQKRSIATAELNIARDALNTAKKEFDEAVSFQAELIKTAQIEIQTAIDETNASIDSYIYLFGEARTANISYLSSLQKITAGMQSFYASVANAGAEIADTLISNLTSGLDESSFLDSIKEYITKMVIQAAVYTDSLTSKLAEIGAAIGKGIASGFSAADLTGLRKELATLYQDASKAASAATAIIGSAFDVPAYANGTDYARGGLALVGEQGAELVNLPRGASVTPARQTAEILGSGSKTVTNNYTFNSPTTLNAADMVTKIKSTQRSLAVAMVI